MEKIWLKSYHPEIPTEIDITQYASINSILETSSAKYADRSAFSNMGTTLTYSQLDILSRRFCSFLQNELHLKKGDRIAIQLPNVLQYPICLYGALRAGLVIVNTNPLYSEREMKHQFRDSGVVAVVILANFAHHLQGILAETQIKHIVTTELGDLLNFPKSLIVNFVIKHVKKMVPKFTLPGSYSFLKALSLGRREAPHPVAINHHDIGFLQYTGGTTGISKGAILTHGNILANMEQISSWMKPRLKLGEEIVFMPLPMYHVFCLTVNALAMVKYGAENLMITNPRDIKAVVKEMRARPYTIMSGVNTLFNALLQNEDFRKLNFSRLKVSVAGGMALQTAVAKRWQEVTGSLCAEGYGLTETSPVVCCNPIAGGDRLGTIGLPLPSTDIKFIDDAGNDVPFGQPGELCVKGPQVMQGYWNQTAETEKVLSRDGWLKTGDVAQIDSEGYVKIVDRKKDLIIVSGFNVYPNEIEEVLASMPQVLEVAAIGLADEHSGEVVKVFIVKRDQSLTAEQVISYAKNNLTGYKVPKAVEFRKDLPKTNVGKILRRELRDQK